jgi:hypothetical protein
MYFINFFIANFFVDTPIVSPSNSVNSLTIPIASTPIGRNSDNDNFFHRGSLSVAVLDQAMNPTIVVMTILTTMLLPVLVHLSLLR